MSTFYPGARWRPCSNHNGTAPRSLGLILHVQVGDNDLLAEFDNHSSEASYNWVAYENGTGDQFVDGSGIAWAQGSGNDDYRSVGTQGFPNAPLAEAACRWIAGLYRWGHNTFGWPYILADAPGQPGFGWHGMGGSAWGGHPFCPGDLRRAQRQHILDLAQEAGPVVLQEDIMNLVIFQANTVDPKGLSTFVSDGLLFELIESPAELTERVQTVWPQLGAKVTQHASWGTAVGNVLSFGRPLNKVTADSLGLVFP